MHLRDDLLRGIYAYGFEKPSAIQQRAIIPCIRGTYRACTSHSCVVRFNLILRPQRQRCDCTSAIRYWQNGHIFNSHLATDRLVSEGLPSVDSGTDTRTRATNTKGRARSGRLHAGPVSCLYWRHKCQRGRAEARTGRTDYRGHTRPCIRHDKSEGVE